MKNFSIYKYILFYTILFFLLCLQFPNLDAQSFTSNYLWEKLNVEATMLQIPYYQNNQPMGGNSNGVWSWSEPKYKWQFPFQYSYPNDWLNIPTLTNDRWNNQINYNFNSWEDSFNTISYPWLINELF